VITNKFDFATLEMVMSEARNSFFKL